MTTNLELDGPLQAKIGADAAPGGMRWYALFRPGCIRVVYESRATQKRTCESVCDRNCSISSPRFSYLLVDLHQPSPDHSDAEAKEVTKV